MGKLILHGMKLSPCVRSTFVVAAAIGVEMEYEYVDLFQGDSRTTEFLEMNPLHSVPVLDDNGKYITDSHAILSYLVDQYGKDDSLYPKEPYKKALVDQRLHFDSGILYIRLKNFLVRIFGSHIVITNNAVFNRNMCIWRTTQSSIKLILMPSTKASISWRHF